MNQLKRMNHQGIKISLGIASKQTNKQIKNPSKSKHRKKKVRKQLITNRIPKETGEMNSVNCSGFFRPHSSLAEHTRKVVSSLSSYEEVLTKNNHKVSINSSLKKNIRETIVSPPKIKKIQNKSVDKDMKRIAQYRRKSNLSCNSMIQQNKSHKTHKNSNKHKKPTKVYPKTKENFKESFQKSKSKSVNKLKKISNSKNNTVSIQCTNKNPFRKKSLGSLVVINPKKIDKKSKTKKKSQKILLNNDQRQREQQYPINKYSYGKYDDHSWRTPSSSFQNEKLKQKKQKNSLLEIDYSSCLNILSASSAAILSSRQSMRLNQQNQINMAFLKESCIEVTRDNIDINLDQIKYYEQNSPHKKCYVQNKKNQKYIIQEELLDNFPQLTTQQLKFLSSVIIIQRKWRQYRFYKEIFAKKYQLKEIESLKINTKDQLIEKQFENNCIETPKIIGLKNLNNHHYLKQEEEHERNQSYNLREQNFRNKLTNQQHNINQQQQVNQTHQRKKIFDEYDQTNLTEIKQNCYKMMNSNKKDVGDKLRQEADTSLLTNDIFPNITYLEVKQKQIKEKFILNMKLLQQNLKAQKFDIEQYYLQKKQMLDRFQIEHNCLKKNKKDIKKGYLRYIDCVNKIRRSGKSGLRKVSSESGLMSVVYKKFFKLEHAISDSSESSDSMRKLTHTLLVRRNFYQHQKIQQLANSEGLLLNTTKLIPSSQRNERISRNINLESNDSSQPLLNKKKQLTSEILVSKTYEYSSQISKLKNKIDESINISELLCKLQTQNIDIKDISQQISQQYNHDDDNDNDNYLIREQKILEMIINYFVIDLETDLNQFRKITINNNQNQYSKINQLQYNKQYHQQIYHISPANSFKYHFEKEDIIFYLKQFVFYLQENQYYPNIIDRMNIRQGFTPLNYLKFLRDYRIPSQQYEGIISNEIFLEWEELFSEFIEQNQLPITQFFSKIRTVFHRCIFEAFISALEFKRPYGQRGQAFPWQNSLSFCRPVNQGNLNQILTLSIMKVQDWSSNNCGVLDEKNIIVCEEDLQHLHEQNQDHIIELLQKQLNLTPHSWYEIEEHCLQLKLELSTAIIEILFSELYQEILQLLNQY